MSPLIRLSATIFIIFASIGVGYILQRAVNRGFLVIDSRRLDKWRVTAQTLAIFIFFPLAAMLSLWGLPNPNPELFALPLLGMLAYTAGGGLAVLFARLQGLPPNQTGAYYCCGAFNNIGAIGALVCLVFLGENAIALVVLFRMLEDFYYFGLSFPIARRFASSGSKAPPRNKKFILVLGLILAALVCGILLNIYKIERPAAAGSLASLLVLSATVIFLITIGMTLRLSAICKYLKPALLLCLIKFCLVPILTVCAAMFLGVENFDKGLALKVVIILSAMPVAMTALAPAAIFGLDLDLANTCWIVSTMALLAVLPALYYIISFI